MLNVKSSIGMIELFKYIGVGIFSILGLVLLGFIIFGIPILLPMIISEWLRPIIGNISIVVGLVAMFTYIGMFIGVGIYFGEDSIRNGKA